jgi:uncharacterized protein involved in outer membrane biogenesis
MVDKHHVRHETMLKKVLLGLLTVVLVAVAGLSLWARSILSQDVVRTALAGQISNAIGQPVTIESISAGIYPRVTVKLGGVTIGEPARIHARALEVGTDFRALLSRQIAHATLRLDGARIELPLPFHSTSEASTPTSQRTSSPVKTVEIVSVDEVVLADVEIISGKRTLRADLEASLEGSGVALRRASFRTDEATINVTGQITNLNGPVGELSLKSDALNFDRFLSFIADFARGADAISAPTASRSPSKVRLKPNTTERVAATERVTSASAMSLAVSLDAARATLGTLPLEHLVGRARVTASTLTLAPIAFGVFGGRYEGTLVSTLRDTPDFHLKASLVDIDMASAMAFAGSPNTITGRLSGRIDLTGRGTAAAAVTRTAHGTARVEIRDGVVKNLGLLREVMLATSMRPDSKAQISSDSRDEPFSRLGATFEIGNGSASTEDLRGESRDLTLTARGAVGLTGNPVNLKGQVQLSEALSQQSGRDLVRYTQEQGRVTVPATIAGSVENLTVHIDVASMAQRAAANRANEEVQKALKKGLGRFIK